MRTYRIRVNQGGPDQGPLMRAMLGIVSVLAVVASAFLGLFVFLAVLGFVAVAGAVMAVRVWFFKRRMEKMMREAGQTEPDYIDAEYSEIRSKENDHE